MTTTVTKESLAARIAELESGARSLKEDYTLAAYKMLLATMEAEPVADVVPVSFDEWSRKCALQITLCYPDFREKAQYIWDSARETQQPAPVVPVVAREPIAWLNDAYLARGVVDGEAGSEDAGPGYIPVYREAGPQQAQVLTFDEWCVKTNQKPQGWVRDAMKEAYEGAISQK
jgi:hypothetical protein